MAFSLLPLFTVLLLTATRLLAQPQAAPVAPGPTAGPLSLSAILAKGGQYATFMRLLKETQVEEQLQSQLDSSFTGLTILAPTDNAFNNLKPGTLNGLTDQEQVALVLYHVLPRYYSLAMFGTSSNPVHTQASGSSGVYSVNVTSTSRQVNVSTGVNEAPINNALYADFPLAVYSMDSVLLPYELFGAKPPAAAPAPSLAPKRPAKKKAPADSAAAEPPAAADTTKSAASFKGRRVGWGLAVGAALVGAIGCLL